MMLASVQTSADTAPFWPYAAGAVVFVVGAVAAFGVCLLIDRWVITPLLRGHLDRARGGNDAEVRAFGREIDRYDAEQTALTRRTR